MKEDKEVCSECGGELGTEHCLDCGYAGDCTDPEYLFKQKPTTEETKNKMSKSQKIARAKSIDAELEYNKLNPSAFKLVITLKTEKGKQYLEETQAFLNHKIFKTITELINTNNLSLRGLPDFWNEKKQCFAEIKSSEKPQNQKLTYEQKEWKNVLEKAGYEYKKYVFSTKNKKRFYT